MQTGIIRNKDLSFTVTDEAPTGTYRLNITCTVTYNVDISGLLTKSVQGAGALYISVLQPAACTTEPVTVIATPQNQTTFDYFYTGSLQFTLNRFQTVPKGCTL